MVRIENLIAPYFDLETVLGTDEREIDDPDSMANRILDSYLANLRGVLICNELARDNFSHDQLSLMAALEQVDQAARSNLEALTVELGERVVSATALYPGVIQFRNSHIVEWAIGSPDIHCPSAPQRLAPIGKIHTLRLFERPPHYNHGVSTHIPGEWYDVKVVGISGKHHPAVQAIVRPLVMLQVFPPGTQV